jgi:hypothetical protein
VSLPGHDNDSRVRQRLVVLGGGVSPNWSTIHPTSLVHPAGRNLLMDLDDRAATFKPVPNGVNL